MSGEFGSYPHGGYLDFQIRTASEDCAGGSYEITRRVGKILEALVETTYAICRAEACDTGEEHPIGNAIEDLPLLKKSVQELENYLHPFIDIQRRAIREHIEKQGKQSE